MKWNFLCIMTGKKLQMGPIWHRLKDTFLPLPGEGKSAGEEHWCGFFVPGAVFVVANQGKSTAGKLYPDLVTAAGVEPEGNQRAFA